MGTNAVLDYFYGKEADQFSFFTVPKILFQMINIKACLVKPRCFTG